MTTLDKVMKMQQEGKSNNEITTQLQNEGVSPTEISETINQASIKNAISPPEQKEQLTTNQEMQPSIMSAPTPIRSQQQIPIATPPQEQIPIATPPQGQYPQQPQEEYYTPQPQAYTGQDPYLQSTGYETETISEIAEQVATEKLEDYKTKVGDVASFKNHIQSKVDNIDDRLKKIETSIEQLQQAILGKIGEFGENYAMVHKDIDNLHETMAKLMNPLIDNVNEMKKLKK